MKPSVRGCVLGVWWPVLLPLALRLMVAMASAAPAQDPKDRFYDPAAVQTIYLEIKAQDLERMNRALPQRICVPGTFRWKDQKFEDVGIRYRGNSSSAPDSPHKRAFLVAFSEYRSGQRFMGLRHVALDNGIQFGSLFSECLITDVLRALDVKASRCNFARVFLNQTNAGIYVNVERIDRSFLQHHFKADKGPLFKVNEGGPGADLRYVGEDPSVYQKTFELHSGKEKEAYLRLQEFIRAINAPTGTSADLSKVLDVEAFVKTTAVMLLAGAFDQYTGWGPHNYYLYQNPADERWTYIPWDLDVGFADNAFGRVPVLKGWHAAWPVPVPGRPLMERLVADPKLLQHYREQASVILETWFRPEVLIPKLRALHAQIRTDLAQDPYPSRRATVPSDTGYEDIIASMEQFIRKRYALARAQLDAPGNRPQPEPGQPSPDNEGPKPGPPSADAPSDLHTIRVTSTSVELGWTNHAEGAVAFVVQRCVGDDCTDFINAIGQGGQNITTATDPHVQPGKTYRYQVYSVLPTPQGPRCTGVSNIITAHVPER
jgi:spore coat protein CotH